MNSKKKIDESGEQNKPHVPPAGEPEASIPRPTRHCLATFSVLL